MQPPLWLDAPINSQVFAHICRSYWQLTQADSDLSSASTGGNVVKEAQNAHLQTGCPIFVELDEAKDKLFSRIVGYQDGKYVIISQPTTSNAVKPRLRIGSTAVIKYVYDGSVIAFRSPVVDQIQDPDQLVFINFPKEVTRQNLRAQKRYQCNFPTKFKVAAEAVEARLEDISLGGSCCSIDNIAVSHMESPPKVGESVELNLQVPGSSQWVTLEGTVSNTFGRNDRSHYGVSFQRLDKESEDIIKQLIFHTIPV